LSWLKKKNWKGKTEKEIPEKEQLKDAEKRKY